MKSTIALSLLTVLSFTTAACSKKDGAAVTGDKAVEGATAAAPAKLGWKKLGALGLEAELADDANVDDKSAGAGYPTATLWASPTTFVSGAGEMSDLKPTIEETKERMIKEEKSLKVTREEKTADGWILEMAGESMGSATIAVSVRRTFDGKPFDCGSNVSSKPDAAKVVKICQSLRAAK